jgi:hypothetical protein
VKQWVLISIRILLPQRKAKDTKIPRRIFAAKKARTAKKGKEEDALQAFPSLLSLLFLRRKMPSHLRLLCLFAEKLATARRG